MKEPRTWLGVLNLSFNHFDPEKLCLPPKITKLSNLCQKSWAAHDSWCAKLG